MGGNASKRAITYTTVSAACEEKQLADKQRAVFADILPPQFTAQQIETTKAASLIKVDQEQARAFAIQAAALASHTFTTPVLHTDFGETVDCAALERDRSLPLLTGGARKLLVDEFAWRHMLLFHHSEVKTCRNGYKQTTHFKRISTTTRWRPPLDTTFACAAQKTASPGRPRRLFLSARHQRRVLDFRISTLFGLKPQAFSCRPLRLSC